MGNKRSPTTSNFVITKKVNRCTGNKIKENKERNNARKKNKS